MVCGGRIPEAVAVVPMAPMETMQEHQEVRAKEVLRGLLESPTEHCMLEEEQEDKEEDFIPPMDMITGCSMMQAEVALEEVAADPEQAGPIPEVAVEGLTVDATRLTGLLQDNRDKAVPEWYYLDYIKEVRYDSA